MRKKTFEVCGFLRLVSNHSKMRSSKVMKDDVKMFQSPPRVDVDASVINRSMLVFISMCKFLTKCNVCLCP